MSKIGPWFAALIAALLTVAHTQHVHDAPEVVYTFTGDALEGPEQLEAGFHTFSLQNDGERLVQFMVFQLRENATPEDIVAVLEQGDDFVTALNAILDIAGSKGGVSAPPGASDSVGIILEPGRYALVEPHDPGAPHVARALEVLAGDATSPPPADVTVRMVDFAFVLPPNIRAGEQTWEVVNAGEQIHHLILARLQEGVTMEDVMAFLERQEEGEPPAENVGFVHLLSSGNSNYVTFDLTPGIYVVLCFVPDHGDNGTGQPHVALGMLASFMVEGE